MKRYSLRSQGIGMLLILILEYILGMISNIFISLPKDGSRGQLWQSAWSQIPIAAHIIIGYLLILGSLILIIRSFMKKDHIWKIASVGGFISIFIAALTGATFITSQQNIYSFMMSLGFMIAFLSYASGIYFTK